MSEGLESPNVHHDVSWTPMFLTTYSKVCRGRVTNWRTQNGQESSACSTKHLPRHAGCDLYHPRPKQKYSLASVKTAGRWMAFDIGIPLCVVVFANVASSGTGSVPQTTQRLIQSCCRVVTNSKFRQNIIEHQEKRMQVFCICQVN
jgi:hypothetical protein